MNAPADSSGLQSRLRSWRAAVDRTLLAFSDEIRGDDPVAGAMRYALETGGKRMRPVLCLAAADAIHPLVDPDPAWLRAASAIELVHTYSLVHDDLPCMDDDDLRRGRPTPHRLFGTSPAMVAGYALIPHACAVLSGAAADIGVNDRVRVRVIEELCRGAGAAGMVGGQVLDLEAEARPVDLAGLRRIHGMKTAALFRAAVRIGGLLAGADAATVRALGDFGERVGVAFQIADDVLDTTMDAGSLGKTPGKDHDAHKSTFASLLDVEAARQAGVDEASGAVEILRGAGIASPLLELLAEFAAGRDR